MPVALVLATRLEFVATFRTVTSAPCTMAPLLSATVPWIAPVCANTAPVIASRNNPHRITLQNPSFFIRFLQDFPVSYASQRQHAHHGWHLRRGRVHGGRHSMLARHFPKRCDP